MVEFTELDKNGLRTPIPLWMERNAEKIPWVKEEYDRVKGGKLATTAGDIPHPKEASGSLSAVPGGEG